MTSGRALIQGLPVDVSGRGDEKGEFGAVLAEEERAVAHFAAGQQEIILRTEHIDGQVVDLDEIGRHDGQLGGMPRQPDGFDDEIARFQLRMQGHVILNGSAGRQSHHVTLFQSAHGQHVLVGRVAGHAQHGERHRSRAQPSQR